MATAFFGGAFFGGEFFSASVAAEDAIRNFSLREWRQWHRPDDERHLRSLKVTPKAAELIADVAAQQAALNRLDEQQKRDHLRAEMRLRGMEMQAQHLALLNAELQRAIDDEIGKRLHLIEENYQVTALLMIAAIE